MTTAFQNNAFQIDAFQVDIVTGVIYATDSNDTASLSGSVTGAVEVYGSISATDQNDVATLLGTITSANVPDTHDGFTPDDIRRAKELDKKAAKAREKLLEAQKAQKQLRKQQIRDTITPPVAKTQQPKVESDKEAKEQALQKVIAASAALKRIEQQRQELYKAVQLRQEQARIMTELAIMRAKELDDEESVLALLL